MKHSCVMAQARYFTSPIGMYKITADREGVTSIQLQATSSVPAAENKDLDKLSPQHLTDCISWLEAYFSGKSLENVKVPALNTQGFQSKPFCRKVWDILKDEVELGQTVTYGELANMAGSPRGARAVGMAMKTNPISLIVPCHRVVKSDGDLGNYSSYNGVASKRWLLEHEAKCS